MQILERELKIVLRENYSPCNILRELSEPLVQVASGETGDETRAVMLQPTKGDGPRA